MKTPYDVLGISSEADEKGIANAFREAAKRCHPDRNPGDLAAERRFKLICAARDALSEPGWRALYQYVQRRRQQDHRQWIVTIASCIISAVVSGGSVRYLQESSKSDSIIPSGLSEMQRVPTQLRPTASGFHLVRITNDEPSHSSAIGKDLFGFNGAKTETASNSPSSADTIAERRIHPPAVIEDASAGQVKSASKEQHNENRSGRAPGIRLKSRTQSEHHIGARHYTGRYQTARAVPRTQTSPHRFTRHRSWSKGYRLRHVKM
jgi:curved DNA-binding protein CbpA